MSFKCPRAFCGGNLLAGMCLLCNRGTVETVSLGEALLGSAIPLDVAGDAQYDRDRQPIPLSVSLERARAWGRGERR